MNTRWYLMLVYLLSVTFVESNAMNENSRNGTSNSIQNNISTDANASTVEGNLATELANGVATNVTTEWQARVKRLSNSNKQLQSVRGNIFVTVKASFKRDRDYFDLSVSCKNQLFGSDSLAFKIGRKDITVVNVPVDFESDEDDYSIVPMLPYWKNVGPLTNENEFRRRASKERYFPYHVLITTSLEENIKWCQGALIKSNWLITSKYCLQKHFGLQSKKSVKVIADAMNSSSILYSNVVLRKSIKDSPIMFEDDPFGFEDLALVKMDTVPETTEVPPVDLKIFAEGDFIEEVYCHFVTRCSDGTVRSMLYEMAGKATQSNLKFLKPGTIIVCENGHLLSIKTGSNSFYPLTNALSWIEKTILEEESSFTTFTDEDYQN